VKTESVIDDLKEDDFFEDIKLYGTLMKVIKNQRSIESSYSTYITYDHVFKKFYLLLLG
jgi:hypothetical protein